MRHRDRPEASDRVGEGVATDRAGTDAPELRLLLPQRRTRIGTFLTGAGASHAIAGLLLALLAWSRPAPLAVSVPIEPASTRVVWTPALTPGGGGGGGGERRAEPPRVDRVTAVRPPAPPPVPVPDPVAPDDLVEPIPGAQLNAVPLDAPPALVGTNVVVGSAGPGSGGGVGVGNGPGSGPGDGPGIGPGNGPGVGPGDGAGGPLEPPTIAYSPKPRYTVEAMSRKVEGDVHLECLALPTGRIGECRVVQTIDGNAFGLDDEALRTAAEFRFNPATRGGQPVASRVRIILEFRIR